MILWTEILPKTLGVKNKKKMAYIIAVPLSLITYLMTPIIYMLNFFNRPFAGKKSKAEKSDLLHEINLLSKYAQSNNQLSSEQQKIVERSIEISSKMLKDIMVKAEKINFLSTCMTLTEALLKAHVYRHTRYLLTEKGDIDRVIGYINFKDIVSALHINPINANLEGISRPVIGLNEDETISNAIKLLLKNYQHIAIVKNEKGKTTGMVTLEDLLESIVGKIEDEYDIIPCDIIRKSDKIYFASGGALMSDISVRMGLKESYEKITVHNFVLGLNHNIIPEKEELFYKEIQIKVIKVRRDKIFEVMIEKI